MNDRERYDDPGLARRFREWVDSEAPPAAPERLVFAVMDEVERSRSRRPAIGRLGFLSNVGQYAALTVVIALGVAIGILATRSVPGPGDRPSAAPSGIAPSGASPGVVPSLAAVAAYQLDATAMAADGISLWIATAGGDLIGLDGESGAEVHRQPIRFAATDLVVSDGLAWAVAPGHDLARIDLATSGITTFPAAGVTRVALSPGLVWMASVGRVVALDQASGATVHDIAVAAHRDTDPIAIVGTEIWVATNAAIQRFDGSSGAAIGSIPGNATDLLEAAGLAWATRGVELARIDPGSAGPTFLEGMPDGALLATDGTLLWVAGSVGGGPGELVALDAGNGSVLSRTPISGEVRGLAAANGAVWLATADQRVRRYLGNP
ncbi:MAG TPA: PQQ-binding-like beta-propeller repeat protein [Candidatus Limnocylindrales bacterium]|jgi:outer membrane protein assembly factor BamB|nr:PQQ-binding-like beta-propeller repeat protein [Candidatus Limnocylindrales bacterium]